MKLKNNFLFQNLKAAKFEIISDFCYNIYRK